MAQKFTLFLPDGTPWLGRHLPTNREAANLEVHATGAEPWFLRVYGESYAEHVAAVGRVRAAVGFAQVVLDQPEWFFIHQPCWAGAAGAAARVGGAERG